MTTSSQNTDDAPLRRRRTIDTSFLILLALTLVAGAALAWRDGLDAVWQVGSEKLWFLALLGPKIIAGLFVAVSLPLMIPRDRVIAALGRDSGLRGLILASAAGMLIPGGPVMTFTLAAGLMGAGAHVSSILTLITSWSILGLNRTIIWEMSFLSWDFVLLRYLICVPMPVLFGALVRAVLR